jgi:CPA1 family monovalent cation:H+ antiporter
VLSIGGVAVGAAIGYAVVKLLRHLKDTYLVIVASALTAWICYVVGEGLDVSGVMATVTYGMMLGWHQHELVSAVVRIRGTAFWQVVIFLLESLVFILIGLSLRGVIHRLGGAGEALAAFVPAVGAIVGAVVMSRFVWILGVDQLAFTWRRLARHDTRPSTGA